MQSSFNDDASFTINCKAGLDIANELGIPPKAIGDACNELGIKIGNCQLGCF